MARDSAELRVCGAPAESGACVLPAGHNMGRLDIPENHQGHATAAKGECVCGAPIKQVTLPPDIARASGRDTFWNHIGGDIYCYENDRQAMAEPLEVTDVRA